MHKRYVHHIWTRLRAVPAFLFLGISIFFLIISVFALRANNQHMLRLREAVFVADEQNGDVEGALRALREYVYSHMNTDLTASGTSVYPPIQLKYRYERLVAAEKARVEATNAQIYTEAQTVCEQRFPAGFSGSGRIPCIQEYVDAHGATEQPIPDAMYKFDFVSPTWSPDLAGWSLVITVLSFLAFVILFGSERWLRHYLHQHG